MLILQAPPKKKPVEATSAWEEKFGPCLGLSTKLKFVSLSYFDFVGFLSFLL